MDVKSYFEGYEKAYAEIYEVMWIGGAHKRDSCNDCKACELVKDMSRYVIETISGHMTPEERNTIFSIMADAYERLKEEMGE